VQKAAFLPFLPSEPAYLGFGRVFPRQGHVFRFRARGYQNVSRGKRKKHLGRWDGKPRPKANPPPAAELEYTIEDAVPLADGMAVNPIYPAETCF
jgi:hypothetical protein